MTAVELDPLFVRALKLLQSKSKDAADQLKQMHDDVISQRKLGVQEKKIDDLKESNRSVDRGSHKKEFDFLKIGDTEKRSLESLKHDSIEAIPVKKFKSDFQHSLLKTSESSRSSKEAEKEQEHSRHKEQSNEKSKERAKSKLKGKESEREEKAVKREEKAVKREEVVKKTVAVFSSSSEDEDDSDTEEESPSPSKNTLKLDTEDFGLDMDDIACVVCKQFNVTSTNRLVECQECHSLYHQECHRPPVTSKNVSDPRFVWYCSRCSKNLKKMVSKPLKSKPAPIPFTKDSVQASKTKLDHSLQQAFRRVDPTKSSLLKESASTVRPLKGLQGMASLAANLSGKLTGDSTKHPKGESKFLVSTAKAETAKSSLLAKSDASKFSSAFSRLDAPKNPSSFTAKLDATKARSSESTKVMKSSSSSSTGGRMSQSSMMSADKRLAMMKKKAEKKINDRKSSLK